MVIEEQRGGWRLHETTSIGVAANNCGGGRIIRIENAANALYPTSESSEAMKLDTLAALDRATHGKPGVTSITITILN